MADVRAFGHAKRAPAAFAASKAWHRGRAIRAQSRRRASGGFTYIGVLLLVALMGISVSVASEAWYMAQKRSKEEELLFVGDQFRRAFAMYNANGAGFPHRLEDLLKDPRFPETRRYLRKVYRDPITGLAEWGLVKSTGDTIIGVYSLSADQPLKKTEFRPIDQSFEGKTKYAEWVFYARTGQAAGAIPQDSSATQPGVARPLPGATQSALMQPAATPSASAQPDTTQSVTTQPASTQPDATQSAAPQSPATRPATTQPDTSQDFFDGFRSRGRR
jgi:type II secretory pathway pseudopilin PulG